MNLCVLFIFGENSETSRMVKSRDCRGGREPHLRWIQHSHQTNLIKCQVHLGAICQTHILHPHSVTETYCSAFSVFFTTWKVKKKPKPYTIMVFKGQSEVLWWEARRVHCTFPLRNMCIPVWPPLWGLCEKFALTKGKHGPGSLRPCLQSPWRGSIPPPPLLLLQPFNLEWCSSTWVEKAEISSMWFNALDNAVKFVTICQIKSGFALSWLRGPIEDHFRCL